MLGTLYVLSIIIYARVLSWHYLTLVLNADIYERLLSVISNVQKVAARSNSIGFLFAELEEEGENDGIVFTTSLKVNIPIGLPPIDAACGLKPHIFHSFIWNVIFRQHTNHPKPKRSERKI